MEADDREPAAGPQHPDRCGEGGLQLAELVVDGDAERLEDPLGGVTLAEPCRGRDGRLDHVDEVAGAGERPLGAPSHDGARDLLA